MERCAVDRGGEIIEYHLSNATGRTVFIAPSGSTSEGEEMSTSMQHPTYSSLSFNEDLGIIILRPVRSVHFWVWRMDCGVARRGTCQADGSSDGLCKGWLAMRNEFFWGGVQPPCLTVRPGVHLIFYLPSFGVFLLHARWRTHRVSGCLPLEVHVQSSRGMLKTRL